MEQKSDKVQTRPESKTASKAPIWVRYFRGKQVAPSQASYVLCCTDVDLMIDIV